MADDVAQMTFELLKKMQGQMNRVEADLSDVKVRMSAVEGYLGQQTIQIGALNARMDRFDERLSRIERRFELVDG